MNEICTRRYDFRLYPNAGQLAAIEHQAAMLARLWNAALQQREDQWRHEVQRRGRNVKRGGKKIIEWSDGGRKGLSYYDQAREIKHIRASEPDYAAMSCASLELCLKALDLAFQAFWRRLKEGAGAEAGYPRYKSARHASTIWHRDGSGWKMRPHGKHWKFYLKGIPGEVKARGRFPQEPTEIRTMEIVKRPDGWFASVVVKMTPRQLRGQKELEVAFDLLDHFASVKTLENGGCPAGEPDVFQMSGAQISPVFQGHSKGSPAAAPETGADGKVLAAFFDDIDADQSARDLKFKKFSYRWRQETKRIAKRRMRDARRRKYALHQWTTDLVRHAAEMTVYCPPVKENTKSARGNAKNHGAAVETVATVNRNTLSQAPAMAVQMLTYKAAEAAINFRAVEARETPLSVGRDLPAARKMERRTRRKLKEQ